MVATLHQPIRTNSRALLLTRIPIEDKSLSAAGTRLLAEIFSKATRMPVDEVKGGDQVEVRKLVCCDRGLILERFAVDNLRVYRFSGNANEVRREFSQQHLEAQSFF